MKFFFSTYDATGHAFPVSAVVRELLNRGHSVVWMCGEDTKALVIKTGATHVPTNKLAALDDAAKPRLNGPLTARGMVNAFVQNRTLAQALDYGPVLEDYAPDCVVLDLSPSGPQALYELGKGPVFATISVFPVWADAYNLPRSFTGEKPPRTWFEFIKTWLCRTYDDYFTFPDLVMAPINKNRRELGLPPVPQPLLSEQFTRSEFLNIALSSPRMEFFDDYLLRRFSNIHFVGPTIGQHVDADEEGSPKWAGLLDHEKIIFVSQGTFATDPLSLVLPTIRALSKHLDLRLIVATQHAEELMSKEQIPPNCFLEKYVPYELCLSRASLFITNGGYGGVKQALMFGVPMICAGTTEDKADVAARVDYNGVGLDLKTDHPTERQIENAVWQILEDETFRENARKIGEEFKNLGGAAHAANLLEELVRTKTVVRRTASRYKLFGFLERGSVSFM